MFGTRLTTGIVDHGRCKGFKQEEKRNRRRRCRIRTDGETSVWGTGLRRGGGSAKKGTKRIDWSGFRGGKKKVRTKETRTTGVPEKEPVGAALEIIIIIQVLSDRPLQLF